ncbi:unnamed protein product, partial [marine sediment metagenome]
LVIQEEAFAPIVAVNKFKTLDEAIAKVNNTKYGLQARLRGKLNGVIARTMPRGTRI